MKSKLAYIDHSFHKKTKSTYFLRDILKKEFEIINIWDESWKSGKKINIANINSQNFEYVLFFQSLPSIKELQEIKSKIIWVPMYDGIVGSSWSFWKELSSLQIKIISFSETLTNKLKNFKMDVLNVRYFFNPKEFNEAKKSQKRRILFWQRTTFSFNDVKKIIGNQQIDRFILKLDSDPGYEPIEPTIKDIKKYNIKVIRGTIQKQDYLNLLENSNIFISPRKFEGIGMSFIEAMSMGMAVVVFDNPTMNEYVKHNNNGYIINSKRIKKINFDNFADMGKNAREYCNYGFKKWRKDKLAIIEFLHSEYESAVELNMATKYCIKLFKIIYKFALKVRSYYK